MPNKSSIPTKNTPYSSLMRVLFFILGCVFLIIGAVGIITPGLPTTVFVLLAAACWARSSKRFYQWLIQHHIFGKMIRDSGELSRHTTTGKVHGLGHDEHILHFFFLFITIKQMVDFMFCKPNMLSHYHPDVSSA